MKLTTIDFKNFNLPAPKNYRKFENAFTILLAPSILASIQSWGLSDQGKNHCLIALTFSIALVKFGGMLLANGQQYEETKEIAEKP